MSISLFVMQLEEHDMCLAEKAAFRAETDIFLARGPRDEAVSSDHEHQVWDHVFDVCAFLSGDPLSEVRAQLVALQCRFRDI